MRRQLLTASALGCVAALTPGEGLANPEDGVVAAGSATIVNAPARVDIHQHSERAVIDWRSFDIAPHETTQFHQPSSSSFALNRVKSNTPSSIAGALIANGNVAVVNPNGVLIQQGAKVDVNSLVVSSADTRNEDFMAGGPLKLDIKGKPDAAVINQGTITAKEAGLVGLVAPHVENSGVIEARLGKVALASGDTAVVDLAGDGLISLAVSDSVAKQLVRNSGAVSADGGTVLITAAAGRELVDSLVTVEGTVRAQTVAEKNGAIIIASAAKGHDATQATVKVAAKLDASGKGAGEKGGAVHVQGERILVAEGTRIDASGDAGGGEVLIGGDYLGGNYRGTLASPDLAADDTAWGNTPGGYSSINGTGLAEYLRRFYDYFRPEGGMPTASRTHVGSDVVVDASARTSGHGGRVIYWSDHGTSYSGHTDVGAYGASGHGGFIEVSGRDWLGYNGSFNALATGGRAGTLLLDPTDMTISNAANSGVTGASPFDGSGPAVSNLNITTLQTALGTGNVTIQSSGGTGGNGDITFVDAVAWNNANSLTVNASRHLTVNNTITNTGTGNITLNANIATTGDLTINNNITTGGSITGLARRNLTLAAGRTLTTGATGALSLQAANGVTTGTGNLNINGNLSVGTGALTLTSGINGARPNWTATGSSLNRLGATFGAVSMQGFNDLGISRIINSTGAVTISNNTRTLLANNVSSTAGAITFGNNLELTEATSATVSATNQNITFGGSVTDTTGGVMESLIVNSGTATTTFSGAVNGLNLTANAGTFSLPTAMGATTPMGNVALTSTNAMTLPAITAATITAQTTGATGDITLGANLTANAASGNITVTAFRNLTVGALSTLTTGAAGGLSLRAANGVTTGTGNLNLNGTLSVGTGALTLTSGINGARPNWTATNTNLVPQSGTFGAVSIQGFQDLTLNRAINAAGNVTLLAFRDLNLPLGSNITTSAAGSISLQAANANIAGTGNLNLASNLSVANGGNLTLTSGVNGTRPNWTATNTNLTVNGGTNFTNITIQGFQDITLNRAINAAGNIGVQAFRDLNLPLGSDITTSAAGSISLQAANANINGTGNLNLASNVSVGLGGNLTLTSGVNGTRPNWTATNTNLTVNGGTNFSNITIQGFQDLTLNRPLTTNAAANSITLLAMRDLNIPAGSNITLANAATGALSLRAAAGNTGITGIFNLGANLAVGTGALTLLSGNGTRPDLTLNTTNLSLVTGAANFGSIDIRGFNNNFVNRAITSGGSVLVYAFRDLNVNNPIASAVSGALDLRAANGSTTGTGNLNLGAPLSVGTGGLTLMSGINGTRPDWTATTTNLVMLGATFGTVFIDGFNNFTLNREINSNGNVTLRSFRDLNVSAGNNITTGTTGFLTLQAANGVTTGTGNLNILSNLSVGTGALTLTSGINGTRPTWTATTTSLVRQGATFGAINIGGFENFIVDRILNSNAAVAFSSNNRVTLGSDVSSGGTGALTFTNSPVVVVSGASVNLSSNNQAITFNAASTVNGTAGSAAETLTVNSGTATTTFSGAVNELNLTANAGTFSLGAAMGATTAMGNVSLTSTNALTLPAITASTILARTTGAAADITLGANLTANATTGTSITLAAGRDLNNSGNRLLNTSGTARWLVYSGDTANATITKGGLTGAFNRYGCNFGGSCPTGVTIPAAGNGFVYTFRPTATLTSVSAANKVYDGLTTATVDTSAAFISGGLLPGDSPTPDYTLVTANFVDKNVGTGKIVTLSGVTDNMGYLYTTSITSDITPKALTVSGAVANNKVYDALTTATLSGVSLVGIVTGDIVNFSAGTTSASFADKNVGTGKAVTVSAIGITGADAGNYTVTSPTGLTANITPAALGMTGVTASNKVYDALTTAALNFGGATFSGLLGGDTVTFNSGAATGNFADKNVGTGKAVTVAGVTIGGADAGNYTFTQPTGVTANITPAALGMTGVTASNKVYDALTSATLNFGGATFSGLLGGDTVTFNSGAATGNFADKNVGTGKAVTVAGVTIGGADAGNYTFTQPTGLTANITPAALSMTGVTASNKVYDTLTSAALNFGGATFSGLFGGDTVTFNSGAATGNFADKNVGTGKAVTVAGVTIGGADAGNYTFTQPTGVTANITPASMTVTGVTASNKIYDALTTATLSFSSAMLSGILGSDSVTLNSGAATGNFADKNVGTGKAVTVAGVTIGGADAGNYTFTQPTGLTANITPAALGMTGVTASNKVYDALTSAALNFGGAAFSGLFGGDTVTFNSGAATGNFADKNVGTGKAVTVAGVTIGGADAGNYTFTQPTGLTANITPASLTVNGVTASNKVYDALTSATLSFASAMITGVLGSDAVIIDSGAASGVFADSNVGTGKAVTVSGVGITGADAGNYTLTQPAGVVADITPATLTVTADNKSRELSQPTPPFTYTATGFQGSDLPSLLTGILMSSVGSGAVPIGNYAITIGGGTAPNYVLNYVNGVLTVLADGSSLPPTPTPGGTVTTPNLDTQSSLLLSLATNQSGNFTITQPGLTAQGQQMYLNTSALNSPTLLAAGGIDTADMETRTYRSTPAGAASSINVMDDAAAAPVLIVPKTTAPIFPPTPFKIPEVMDI